MNSRSTRENALTARAALLPQSECVNPFWSRTITLFLRLDSQRATGVPIVGFEKPTKREVELLILVSSCILAISALALGEKWWRSGFLGEWLTYFLTAIAILCWQPIRRALSEIDRRVSVITIVWISLLVLGQFIGGGPHIFPLVRFNMFSDSPRAVLTHYHYIGVTAEGSSSRVDPVQLYPSLVKIHETFSQHRKIQEAIELGPSSHSWRALDQLMLAMLARYNRTHSAPLIRLELYAITTPTYRNLPTRTAVNAVRIWAVEVD